MTVKMSGLQAIQANIARMQVRVRIEESKAINETVEEAAKEIEESAPVDTGTMAGAVTTKKSTPARLSGTVYMKWKAFYWRFINDGTVNLPPNPFVDRVRMQQREKHAQRVRDGMRKAVFGL